MKKQYTKRQITEAIAYWEKQLKKLNESSVIDGVYMAVTFDKVQPDITAFWSFDSYEWGIKESDDALDILRQWKAEIEKYYKDHGFAVKVVKIDGPVHYDNEFHVGLKCLAGCDKEALKDFLEHDDEI